MIARMSARRILFLPGAGGDGRFWKPVADRLETSAEKVLLDWPGLGHVPGSGPMNGFSDLVDRVVQELREPAHVVAQSMGGVVAVAAALRRPEEVERLVLTATSAGIDAARFRPHDWRPEYQRDFPRAARWVTESWMSAIDGSELRKIRCPVLLLWGDADPIAPVGLGKHLVSLLPAAQLVIVKGGDHSFAALRPAEVAPHVAKHLGLESLGDWG
jgi:pimeloyl-ACP methyl ester carboxylesterase